MGSIAVLFALACAAVPAPSAAQTVTRLLKNRGTPRRPYSLILPYAFYSESFGFALGVGASSTGLLGQDQLSGFVTGTAGVRGSWSFLTGAWGIRLGHRLFMNPRLMAGRFVEPEVYVDGNPDFPDERAGSNDSSEDNFIDGTQRMGWATFDLEYLLPIGHGRDPVIRTYWLEDGLLAEGATGGTSWNPMKSGRSSIVLSPFWRNENVDWEPSDLRFRTLNLRLAVQRDNRDFVHNPSRGSFQKLAYTRDGGWISGTDSWSFWEVELRKYISLGRGHGIRQRVLALNFWTGNSPSCAAGSQHCPPYFGGATLGGFFRMRGYPTNRFHDTSVAYYSAEYRNLLSWNPASKVHALDTLEIDWFQLVLFVELGRVDDGWRSRTFYEDLHWDAGVGIRAMVRRIVVRMDFAFSDQSSRVTVMAGPSF